MPHQAKMHNAPQRFRIIVGGRRSGKSKSSFHEMFRHAMSVKDALCWWVSPTYNEAREIGLEEFISIKDSIAPIITGFHKGSMRVELWNGSKIYFKGADRRDSLRGRGLTFCVMDEAAFLPEDIWGKIIRPALADRKGRAIMGTTPNGRNWLWELWENAPESWSKYLWPSMINPLMDEAEIDALASELSDMDFRQEVLAEFVTRSGQVWIEFTDANKIDVFKPDIREHEIYIGADFGFANPAALLFFAVDKIRPKVVQFDEIYGSRMTMNTIQQKIVQTLGKYDIRSHHVKAIFTDPAGNAEEITSGISPVDELRKTYQVHNKGTHIAPGVALVRAFMCNAKGERRFFVTRNCVNSIKSYEGYVYAPAGVGGINEEPLKDGIHDHCADALRYFFVNRFDHARWISGEVVQKAYTPQLPHNKRKHLKRCHECNSSFLSDTDKHQPPYICGICQKRALAG